VLTPASPPPHATPALVAHPQGGLTLGPERGELAADFWSLGTNNLDCNWEAEINSLRKEYLVRDASI
jgi:hypothetical protein